MFLDTSGLLCLHDRGEAFHNLAYSAYRSKSKFITHNLVLTEFVALAQVRRQPREDALTFVADLADNPDIEVVFVDQQLQRIAVQLLFARLDKTYSLCDAVSFVIMKERNIQQALTTDRHFEQEGFHRLLKEV
jgi:uncharacterized protein